MALTICAGAHPVARDAWWPRGGQDAAVSRRLPFGAQHDRGNRLSCLLDRQRLSSRRSEPAKGVGVFLELVGRHSIRSSWITCLGPSGAVTMSAPGSRGPGRRRGAGQRMTPPDRGWGRHTRGEPWGRPRNGLAVVRSVRVPIPGRRRVWARLGCCTAPGIGDVAGARTQTPWRCSPRDTRERRGPRPSSPLAPLSHSVVAQEPAELIDLDEPATAESTRSDLTALDEPVDRRAVDADEAPGLGGTHRQWLKRSALDGRHSHRSPVLPRGPGGAGDSAG